MMTKEDQDFFMRERWGSLRAAVVFSMSLGLSALTLVPPAAEANLASSHGIYSTQEHDSWSWLRRRRTPPCRTVANEAAYRLPPLGGLDEGLFSGPKHEVGDDEDGSREDSSDPCLSSYSPSAEDSYGSDESDVTGTANINYNHAVFSRTGIAGLDFSEEGEAAASGSRQNFADFGYNGPPLASGGDSSANLRDASSSIIFRDHTTAPATVSVETTTFFPTTVGEIAKAGATAAVGLAAVAPLVRALFSHWPYFVAGGICASISHTAAVPLDVIKTRMQCAEPGEYRGTWDAFVRICRSEGVQVLFCGAGATFVGYAMQGCLKFGFFEFLKPFFSSLFVGGAWANGVGGGGASGTSGMPLLGSLVAASVAAEVVGSSALTPLEATRIRMVADSGYAPGLRSGIARMISEEGIGALTRGLPAVLAKQIPYTVTKLVTFDVFVRAASRAARHPRINGRGGGGGVALTACCAVAAGMLSSLASQPGDSLLSTLNNEGRRGEEGQRFEEGRGRKESVARAMARIAREAGFFGLFRGTTARMMHVTFVVTVQLLIYQSVKSMVGISS